MNRTIALCTKIAFAVVVLALTLGSSPLVQAQQAPQVDDAYMLGYYSHAHTTGAPDATLRLTNDGNQGDSSPGGDLCAAIYVFDTHEAMQECCSCKITPNGYLALSVNNNLTSSPIESHKINMRGVIKVLSVSPTNGRCDPTNVALCGEAVFLQPGIRGWLSHIQRASSGFAVTDIELKDSDLGSASQGSCPAELADLQADCQAIIKLGAGSQGVCSCADSGE
jgi:hypothetical protein